MDNELEEPEWRRAQPRTSKGSSPRNWCTEKRKWIPTIHPYCTRGTRGQYGITGNTNPRRWPTGPNATRGTRARAGSTLGNGGTTTRDRDGDRVATREATSPPNFTTGTRC